MIMENKAIKELTLTRLLDAPRELVFKVWTEAEHLAKWWGPRGFTNPRCEADARAGGAIRIDMQAPDGSVNVLQGSFREIQAPQKVVFTIGGFEDENGEQGVENLITATFEEENGKTRLTTHVAVIKAAPYLLEAVEGMEEGWTQSIDRMQEYAEGI
jgi:uncharacterized protein YndB with AHSA1/START domain